MRHWWQRLIGWVTIYTIVLQAFAVGLTPPASAHGLDPLSIICASSTSATADNQGSAPAPLIAHGCDHCVLCGATTPPEAPDTATKVSFRAPALPFSWPPAALPARKTLQTTPELPTGPPAIA